jgi:hypothetical protein
VRPDCRYPYHRATDWRRTDGGAVCGVCHPDPREPLPPDAQPFVMDYPQPKAPPASEPDAEKRKRGHSRTAEWAH